MILYAYPPSERFQIQIRTRNVDDEAVWEPTLDDSYQEITTEDGAHTIARRYVSKGYRTRIVKYRTVAEVIDTLEPVSDHPQ